MTGASFIDAYSFDLVYYLPMKNNIIIIAIIGALVGGYFVLKTTKEPVVTHDISTYSNKALGFQFDYRAGPDGYVLEEATPSDTSDHLLKVLTLSQTKDVQAGVSEGGEGPATITMYVFDNVKKQQPSVWLLEHKNYSGIQKTEPVEWSNC